MKLEDLKETTLENINLASLRYTPTIDPDDSNLEVIKTIDALPLEERCRKIMRELAEKIKGSGTLITIL